MSSDEAEIRALIDRWVARACNKDIDGIMSCDVAFCHYLFICGGTDEDGNEQTGWMRGTACLRRIDGQWLITHEHYSVPFDPESMKALTELQPSGVNND